MLMVGLTGGIGAGKSAVAKRLVRRGAVLIDSDRLAREVVAAGTDGLAEVVAAFGPAVLGGDGELNRPALAARVFGDEPARRTLEGVIHPRVRARSAELAAAAAPDAVVVNDVPLLVEVGLAPSYHLVLVVEADEDVRVRRLIESRGMAPEQARARIAAQAGDATRRAAGDVVLRNDAGLSRLDEQVEQLWRDRLLPFERNLRGRRPAPLAAGPAPVAAPDPTWATQAARIVARIEHALRPVLGTAAVCHIGSTAVPELPARDILDLMLAPDAPQRWNAVEQALTDAGLPPRRPDRLADRCADLAGNGQVRLHGSADPGRPVDLRLWPAASADWRLALLVRDHLRSVPAVRHEYAAAKRAWAATNGGDGYAAAKAAWFDTETAAAQRWAADTGWVPRPHRPAQR